MIDVGHFSTLHLADVATNLGIDVFLCLMLDCFNVVVVGFLVQLLDSEVLIVDVVVVLQISTDCPMGKAMWKISCSLKHDVDVPFSLFGVASSFVDVWVDANFEPNFDAVAFLDVDVVLLCCFPIVLLDVHRFSSVGLSKSIT